MHDMQGSRRRGLLGLKLGHVISLVLCACATQAHAAAAKTASSSSAAAVVPEAETTINWIKQHGGQVHVIVQHTPDSGRAVFAPRDFHKGDVLAAIPFECAYVASTDIHADVQFTALKLLEDLHDPGHSHRDFFASLPPRDGVWSMHDIPKSYLPLIQSKDGTLEKAISDFQDRLQLLWDKIAAVNTLPGTFEDLKHATAHLMTRLFQFEGVGLIMIPLVDMGNHRNDCRNTHLIESCPFDADQQCVIWRAGNDIPEGTEVCNFYKFMLNDRSLLQYGFLQLDAVSSRLSGVDRPDFNASQPWQDLTSGENGPMLFEGTSVEIEAEMARLKVLQAALQDADVMGKQLQADPADSGGWFLQQLLLWRQQRQQAINKELDRLQRQLQRVKLGEAGQADGGTYGKLTEWLEANSAVVNVVVRDVSDSPTDAPNPPSTQHSTLASQQQCTTSQDQTCKPDLTNETTVQQCTGPAITVGGDNTITGHGRPNSSRMGVFARSSVKQGEPLAVIPMGLTQRIKDGNDGYMESLIELLPMMANRSMAPATPTDKQAQHAHHGGSNSNRSLEPLLAALPVLGSVHGLHNLPQEYLPLINNQPMERHIRALQALLRKGWDAHRPVIEAVDDSLTFKELQHVASLVTTRSLGYDEGTLLVPLLSMTSPHLSNNCQHYDYVDKCPAAAAAAAVGAAGTAANDAPRCIYWVAGADVQAGEEVCLALGQLPPDLSLLQYGVQQQQPTAAGAETPLFAMDRHDFDPEQPFAILDSEAPATFEGTRDQALTEAARLSTLHTDLIAQQLSPEITTTTPAQPAHTDPHGRLLQQLQELRQLRVAAVAAEIKRLMQRYSITHGELQQVVKLLKEQQIEAAAADAAASEAGGSVTWQQGVDGGGDSDPRSQMIEWMKHHGGTVNVVVQDAGPQLGRVVITAHPLRRGDMIAAIPLQLTFSMTVHGGNNSYELAAANLWDAMSTPDHPLQPWFKSLPKKDELMCPLVDMPAEYLTLVNNNITESCIRDYQRRISVFWDAYKAELQGELPTMTIEDLKYARSLIATRIFKHSQLGGIMIPLLDMSNHREDCPHMQTLGPCPRDPSQECMLWHAGANLAAGEEVCNFYKLMLNDQSFWQYGFMQAGDTRLHNMDRTDFTDDAHFWSPAWKEAPDSRAAAAMPGLPVDAEIKRLQALADSLQHLTLPEAAASDPGGRVLLMMRNWLDERRKAIQEEIHRLQKARPT